MNLRFEAINNLGSTENTEIISYLDSILNHRVNKKVWDWEFNSIPNTIFTIAQEDEKIVGTQSKIPVKLGIGSKVVQTAKSETAYLDPKYRGKKVFENLYAFAIEKTVEKGTKIIWGFTHAPKVWRKNLKYIVVDDVIHISRFHAGYFPFFKNISQSRNIIFALGKYMVFNSLYVKFYLKKFSSLYTTNNIKVKRIYMHESDIDELYHTILLKHPNLIYLYLSKDYVKWRITNNPVLQYRHLFFYQDEKLIGYIIYTICNNVLILTDLTYNLQEKVLEHMLKYVMENEQDYYLVQYWGNISCPVNQPIFKLFNHLGAKTLGDKNRNLVYQTYSSECSTPEIHDIKNWYINGLWTEGFHI